MARSEAPRVEEEIAMAGDGTLSRAAGAQPRWLVPQPYAGRDSSGLTAEVKPGVNNRDFNLSAK